MKAVKCPYCGGPTKRNGRTSSGGAEMEMHRLRRIDHRALRQHRRPLRRVPVVASVEGHAARDARRWPDLQAQDRGVLGGLAHTVAMTGDGVNETRALKAADCSVAMAAGSDAARNVAQLVLVDNDFGSMPKVVAEGRRSTCFT